jgi:LPXTG-motif cell wall-anchored protein
MQWWFWAIVAAGILVLAGAVYFLKKRKPSTPTAPTPPAERT